jgi:pre-60S factor REI1
MFSI